MNVTPELDALMWSLAERHDARAIQDFQARHPELGDELGKRVATVRRLRESKMPAAAVPAFALRPPRGLFRTPMHWAVGAASLVAIAAGAFVMTEALLSPASGPMTRGERVDSRTDLPRWSDKKADSSSESWLQHRLRRPHLPQTIAPPMGPIEENDGPPPSAELPPSKKPMSVHLDHANLLDVMNAVAAQAQLKLELAPQMDNPEIKVDYDDMDAFSIFKDLGRRYGFTAFDEGDSNVLVIPAVDHGSTLGEPDPAGPPQDEPSH